MKLFSVVHLNFTNPTLFFHLVLSCPHISGYVKTLFVSKLSDPFGKILALLPALKQLRILPEKRSRWQSHPANMRADFYTALSLKNFRCIEMADQTFADARELDGLLSQCAGLMDLILQNVSFVDTSSKITSLSPAKQIVLDSLKICFMEESMITAMLHSFTKINVTNLISLELVGTPAASLLAANASSLHDMKIKVFDEAVYASGAPFQGTMVMNLRTIDLDVYRVSSAALVLASFGWFKCFPALEAITLTIRSSNHPIGEAIWADLDARLELREINIYGGTDKHKTRKLREWLPRATRRGSLVIYSAAHTTFK
ncbi:hypothetical protein B0H11DRAFT_2208981 [Mycena galericulata]|nr:hypothetical protein B0H11DRAFT_2208981 [Mycena galericulata]